MFSSNIHLLPSLYYYEDVVKYYKDTPAPRGAAWHPNERPLDGNRKHHYRITKADEETYLIHLYETAIVTWYGPNKAVVSVSHGSSTTMQFAYRYTRAFGVVASDGGRSVFIVDGIKWHAREPMTFVALEQPPGAPPHLKQWRLVSKHSKLKRKVLDPDKAHEYRQASKDFKRWARGIWAMAGNDGSHPWENEPRWVTGARGLYELDIQNKDHWEPVLLAGIRAAMGYGLTVGKIDIEAVLRKIDTAYQKNMHIQIDYDAPLPKRSKE